MYSRAMHLLALLVILVASMLVASLRRGRAVYLLRRSPRDSSRAKTVLSMGPKEKASEKAADKAAAKTPAAAVIKDDDGRFVTFQFASPEELQKKKMDDRLKVCIIRKNMT